MSYTYSTMLALCDVANLGTAEEEALKFYEHLVKQNDEPPGDLSTDPEYADDCISEILGYLSCDKNQLSIAYDSEEPNCNPEIFDFLITYYAKIQSSSYMVVNWTCYDSRDGLDSGTDYYDQAGNLLNLRHIIEYYLENKDK